MAVVVVLMRAIFRLVAPLFLAAGILSPASGLVVPGQSLDTSASALSSRVLVGLTGPGLADPEGLVPVLSSAFIPGDRPSAPVRSSREATAPSTTRFGPVNPEPLDDAVAATFRSASYDEVLLSQNTLLYRAYGGEAGPIGGSIGHVRRHLALCKLSSIQH